MSSFNILGNNKGHGSIWIFCNNRPYSYLPSADSEAVCPFWYSGIFFRDIFILPSFHLKNVGQILYKIIIWTSNFTFGTIKKRLKIFFTINYFPDHLIVLLENKFTRGIQNKWQKIKFLCASVLFSLFLNCLTQPNKSLK